jgi:hypothetical protein
VKTINVNSHVQLFSTRIYAGLLDSPLFSMLAPELQSIGLSLTTQKPPGGPGKCPVIKNGSFYNATCGAKRNFGCEEKKLPPDGTDKKFAFGAIKSPQNNFGNLFSYSSVQNSIFS